MILANPAYRPVALSRRILPRGWAHLAIQLALFAVLDLVYETTRMLAVGDRGVAIGHAHDIVSAERTLGIFHELSVQHFAARHDLVQSIANWMYFNCQFTISFGFLLWVYLRRNDAYPIVRNVFLAANAIGLVCYALYPAAPPRMLGGLGFVDTLNQTSVNHNSGLIASLANPYAAMPSLHTAYALTVGVSAVLLVRNPVLRVAWAFYPALVVFSIVATANHFFLDAAGGASVAAVAALSVVAARRRSRRIAAALVALPVASFLAYRFAGEARDTVSTLAAVAIGALLLSLAANLLSVWLKAAVWRRTLTALPDAPRLTTRDLLPSVFIGFLFNTVLVARLGEVAKVAVLRRRLRRDGSEVGLPTITGTLVAEQLVLGAALVAVGAVLALTIVELPAWAVTTLIVLGAVTGGAVVAGLLARRASIELPPRLARLAGPARELAAGGMHIARRPRQLGAALALGAGSWAAQIAGIYWTLDAVGLTHSLAAASAVFLVSTLVGLFPVMPGNVGVFQLAVAGVLATSFGVSAEAGAAFAVVLQASEVALGAGIGALYLVAEGLSFADLRRQAAPVSTLPARDADEPRLAYAA
ncbi:MAG TPA: phosphatase PAP2 family protein [Gaiellales bacterium]|jgi:uncharacterized membrane protein YbhN (UPF0104 family)